MKTIYAESYKRMIQRLQEFRKRAGLSQTEVGRRIKMSRHWVRKIECCELRLDVLHLILLCRVYGVRAHTLVQKMDDEPSEEEGFFYLWAFRLFECVWGGGCRVVDAGI